MGSFFSLTRTVYGSRTCTDTQETWPLGCQLAHLTAHV